MAGYNFIRPNRDQLFLMPPALQDWLPADDLAHFLLDALRQFDPAPSSPPPRAAWRAPAPSPRDAVGRFARAPGCAAYRADGVGQAAFQPHMMVALLLYAYCLGVRSSRQIERLCQRDVAFRRVAGDLRPAHAPTPRARQAHGGAHT